MHSRIARITTVIAVLIPVAVGCSLALDFDESKIPPDDTGVAEETGVTPDTRPDSGIDSAVPTDTADGTVADLGVDSDDSTVTDGGVDSPDTTPADADASVDSTDGGTDAGDTAVADTSDAGVDTAVADASDAGVDTAVADTGDAGVDTAVADTGDAGVDTAVADTGDAGVDTAVADTGDAGTFSLRVENYLSWCKVSVNGGSDSTLATQTFTFPAATVVNLHGDTADAASFFWKYWLGTAGDVGASHDTAKTTTVVMTGNKVIQACCPLNGDTADCPAPP